MFYKRSIFCLLRASAVLLLVVKSCADPRFRSLEDASNIISTIYYLLGFELTVSYHTAV